MVIKVVLWGEYARLAGGTYQRVTGARKEIDVEIAEGSTLNALVERVADMFGTLFAHKVIARDKRVLPNVSIFVDGQGVDMGGTRSTRTVLSHGQVVEILRLSYLG